MPCRRGTGARGARSGVRALLHGVVERIGRATPTGRERAVDGIRAFAVCCVVSGHWLVTAPVVWADGGLRVASPLRDMPALAPLSWIFQALGLFFLVGGYVSARGLARARERGSTTGAWVRARVVRLTRPLVFTAAVWGVLTGLFAAAGVADQTLRTAALLVVQPMWFIVVYAAITASTSVVVAADRRWGLAAVVAPLAVVAAVDLARFGPWREAVPAWVGLLTILPAWLFSYQVGVAWARGGVGRRAAWTLLVVGAAGLVVLVGPLDYPVSAVGVPGAERGNANPPSLFVPSLAAAQIGVAVLARERLERLLRRPPLWAAVAALNLAAMTVFCWHQGVLVLTATAASGVGVVPGLTSTPSGPEWIAARLSWLPVLAALLVAVTVAARRFEGPWERTVLGRAGPRAVVALAAVGFTAFALVVI
ncbi:Acyltransferase family protein [Marinactinospora thermotolerans DSM 45154]|uniref:Acyltransferase family protein n=1 Tax=Marinactinospora thermotolerans DSM 45154 TaxID=1122192 RepID=A0A1T4SCV5_9ACTN|nr:acyltransferase [Marinactinospora thermotolerans]SKA25691.1 Acyltransferase family protein [Marinactinospora thermotolerans DSM 45154]